MAILIQIPTTKIQIIDANLIVNSVFFYKLPKKRGF